MKRFFIILIIFTSFFLGIFSVDLVAGASIFDFFYKVKDYLTVSGNKILFNNDEIYLRGVAVGDPYLRQEEFNRGVDDYEIIKKEWQANLVRLSVHPGAFKSNEKKVKKYLDDEINAAREQGLFVVVDWHVIGFPNGWYKELPYGGSNAYSYDSNFITANDFWKYMAATYRSDRGVMFELWNEPAKDDFNWEKFRPYMQRLHDLIRSNGAENIIIAPGVWWTYDLRDIAANPLYGENIAYSWHNYPNCGNYLRWSQAIGETVNKFPVILTEWGFSAEDSSKHYYSTLDNGYVKYLKDFLLDNNIHFTAWCWHSSWDPNMLEKDWQTTTEYGAYVKDFLADIESGWAYLGVDLDETISDSDEQWIADFIKYGIDWNSIYIGEGERKAVIFSFQSAFGRLPKSETDRNDIKMIVNGHWPSQRNSDAEGKAKNSFRYIYQREPNMTMPCDDAAITIMAYGLRQRAENRNLKSEEWGLIIFKNLYNHLPETTEDWNILQAITYSGACR
jgi:hypothetical protein